MIDCVYIIALEKNILNNREDIVNRFNDLNIPTNQLVLFKGVNGFNPQVDFEWSLFPWKIEGSDNPWWNRDQLPGEIGCNLSHLAVWKHAHANKFKKILILEEDFKQIQPFDIRLLEELDRQEWHLCYLGRNKIHEDQADVSENLVVPDYSYNLHAYLLSDAGIKNLLDHQYENKIMPADEFVPATFCDHHRDDLKFIWKDTKAFSFKEDYIGQLSNEQTSTTLNLKESDVSST